MQIGVNLPNHGPGANGASVRDAAARANELGFHSVWVGDHTVRPGPTDRWPFPAHYEWLDPLLSLTWAASAAPDVQLGTAVLVLPLRDPIPLAKQIASLNHLTRQQVLLGVGIGWMKEEFDALGRSFVKRGQRSEEMVQAMRQLWMSLAPTFHGEFITLNGLGMNPLPERLPVVLWGGHSPAALRRVARIGDGWHPYGLTTMEFDAARVQLEQLCQDEGRDARLVIITANIGASQRLSSDLYVWYRDRGVDHLVCTPPGDPTEYLHELKRIANLCGLRHR
jgi:probable F420-dependent oxidoreductase